MYFILRIVGLRILGRPLSHNAVQLHTQISPTFSAGTQNYKYKRARPITSTQSKLNNRTSPASPPDPRLPAHHLIL